MSTEHKETEAPICPHRGDHYTKSSFTAKQNNRTKEGAVLPIDVGAMAMAAANSNDNEEEEGW